MKHPGVAECFGEERILPVVTEIYSERCASFHVGTYTVTFGRQVSWYFHKTIESTPWLRSGFWWRVSIVQGYWHRTFGNSPIAARKRRQYQGGDKPRWWYSAASCSKECQWRYSTDNIRIRCELRVGRFSWKFCAGSWQQWGAETAGDGNGPPSPRPVF